MTTDREELRNALVLLVLMAAICWLSYTAGWLSQQDEIENWKTQAEACQQ